jgi:hypothetical protein
VEFGIENGGASKANAAARKDFGYAGGGGERKLAKDYWSYVNDALAKRDIQRKEAFEDFIDETGLPEDIAFVFHSLEKCEDDDKKWRVTPKEAPSPGAWAMLVWAANHQDQFYTKLIPYLMKEGGVGDEGREEISSEARTMEELERIISEVV